jgi:anti-sigma factor RsiW
MMAMSRQMREQDPGEIEAMLPWHAAGTLNARDAGRVEAALARDPELARQYAAIREEYAATIHLNESLGAPSSRAMYKLFAAIDAEPARTPGRSSPSLSSRVGGFFAGLSPRALAWSAALGAVALLLQAGVIGAMLARQDAVPFQTASYQPPPEAMALRRGEPITRSLVAEPEQAPRAVVRFAPDARAAEIAALLDAYQASVVDSARGGTFRLQFGDRPMSKQDAASLMNRLQREKIVSYAQPAQ